MEASYFLIGIKGTGMSSLALLLKRRGAYVWGCDSNEVFQTDSVLEKSGITVVAGFDSSHLDRLDEAACIIYSTAFGRKPIVSEAKKRGFRIYSYIDFLADLTKTCQSYGVAGTHGKTTSTAATCWALSQGNRSNFPFFALFGSFLQHGSDGPIYQGSEDFLLECCEYEDHFLSYRLRGALLTNVEWDHPDYFDDYEATVRSFETFACKLEQGGFLLYCHDDSGAKKVAEYTRLRRPDLRVISYGFDDPGPFGISIDRLQGGYRLPVTGLTSFSFPVWGKDFVRDLVGAAVFATCILLDRPNPSLYLDKDALVVDEALVTVLATSLKLLSSFPGTEGRCQIMAEDGGVTFVDDYAHHPTEIQSAIASLRSRWPNRHLLVIFAPHTSSRTRQFFKQFVAALDRADKVIVQDTFASAREDLTDVNYSELLAEEIEKSGFRSRKNLCGACIYVPGNDEKVAQVAAGWLQEGDVCITMGAGNNHWLYRRIIERRNAIRK
jgi:UDP-N-acetylmuramate--alanine ligase